MVCTTVSVVTMAASTAASASMAEVRSGVKGQAVAAAVVVVLAVVLGDGGVAFGFGRGRGVRGWSGRNASMTAGEEEERSIVVRTRREVLWDLEEDRRRVVDVVECLTVGDGGMANCWCIGDDGGLDRFRL